MSGSNSLRRQAEIAEGTLDRGDASAGGRGGRCGQFENNPRVWTT